MPLLTDPLAEPLFWPTARTIGGLLLAILVVALLVERRRGWALARRPLLQKWLSWAAIAPLYGLAILGGALPAALLTLALSLQCLREYGRLAGLPARYRFVLLALGALAAPAALLSPGALLALPPLLLLLATLQLLVRPGEHDIRPLALAAFGWGYLALLPAHLALLHRLPGGAGLLLTLGLAVALSDVAAFTLGKLVGRHPLAPRLSPSKTWEGVVGNLVGAAAGVGLMAFAWPAGLTWPAALGLAALIGLGCAWGDLAESAVKRSFAAKDAGAWLPGFGGLLDRADSLIVVLPLVFYALTGLTLLRQIVGHLPPL
jgi:phosphatidate cytidylyltransferase